MSANLIALPFRPTLNLSGKFESGAILAVYKIDSSSFEPIYSDADLINRLPNPLRADGFGVFPAIYYDSEQPIRVIIQDSTGATLFDLNPYIASPFEAEAILDQATAQTAISAQNAAEAMAAADRAAVSEAIAVAFAGPSYESTSAGIANTVNGEYFYVNSAGVISVYLNVSETAVLQYTLLSATQIEAALAGKANTSHTHAIADVTSLQASLDAKAPLSSPAFTGTPTANGLEIGFRKIPRRTTATTSIAGDVGGCVALTANITIPNGVFVAGDAVSYYNDSASPVTLTQGDGLTLRLAGSTTTGNRTLAPRGIATVWFNSASEAICSGPGVT